MMLEFVVIFDSLEKQIFKATSIYYYRHNFLDFYRNKAQKGEGRQINPYLLLKDLFKFNINMKICVLMNSVKLYEVTQTT